MNKYIVGSIETISLPGLDLFNLDAKVDTGKDASGAIMRYIINGVGDKDQPNKKPKDKIGV